jgi:hypothetical protein
VELLPFNLATQIPLSLEMCALPPVIVPHPLARSQCKQVAVLHQLVAL